jgi:hypothetical protein
VPPIQARVLANNRAIAELKNGDPAVAATLAASAVAGDPANAIFHSTEAWALQRLGRWSAAVAAYRTAVALDPTMYPAANDLGVLLMQRHRYAQAAEALRRAVGANPRYALGWFNLGVALSHLGPLHYPASQGSLGRAGQLDARFQHHPPAPVFDDVPYVTNLDLSKPLPAHWTFADDQRRAPIAAAGLAAILLLGLGLARALLPATVPGGAERWLAVLDTSMARLASVRWIRNPLLALAATVAVFIWPLHAQGTGGWVPVAAFVAGLLVLAAVAFEIRVLAARKGGLRARQETWLPGVVLGVVAAAGGLGWAPLPVARAAGEDGESTQAEDHGSVGDEARGQPAEHEDNGDGPELERAESISRAVVNLHWAAPAILGALALIQLLLAAWLNVPITRALGAAALVMAASLLTPVKPLDGGTIAATPSGALTIVALAGTAVLVLLGVL